MSKFKSLYKVTKPLREAAKKSRFKKSRKELICLGIESTAHTFATSIITDKGKILSDVRDMYKTTIGGIIPIEAAKHHEKVKDQVIEEAIKQANINLKDIDLISFSQGPGLPPSLLVGLNTAKELAKKINKPLIGINHLIAHLSIGNLFCKVKNPVYILATGANTQIISLEGGYYRIFGESLDIGIGNALDKFGRAINLGFPAGPKIEELAKKGKYIELPYVVKGTDFSLSGIITDAINKFKNNIKKEDLCFSLQENLFAMLTEVTERALAHTEKNEVLLVGGVAANKRLCEMLNIMCKDRKAEFNFVPLKYSGDNAVMIAWQGILEYKSNKTENLNKIDIKPFWRLNQVKVDWI